MQRREWLIGVFTAGFGLVVWLLLIPWQIRSLEAHEAEISPAFFPRLLAWLLILLGLLQMGLHWPRRGSPPPPGAGVPWKRMVRAAGAMGIAAGYVLLMEPLGYTAATALALAALILYLGRGKVGRAAAVAIPMAFLLAEFFTRWMQVPLPRGLWTP